MLAVRERFHVPTGNKILWMLSESSMKEVLRCQLTKTKTQEPGMSFRYIDWTGKKTQKLKKRVQDKRKKH